MRLDLLVGATPDDADQLEILVIDEIVEQLHETKYRDQFERKPQ